MTDPTSWLVGGDAPEAARQLLRAIEMPRAPSPAKQGELVQKLATLAAGPGLGRAAAQGGSWMKLALAAGGSAGSAALLLAALHVFSGARPTADEPATSAAMESTSSLVAAPLPPAPAPSASAPPIAASNEAAESRAASNLPARAHRSYRDALAAEESLLEQARGFAAGAPARAWELLERHRRRFPSGQLVAERLFLSVDVLKRLGNTQGARAQAETLMRQFPASVYAVQLRLRLHALR